jgi:predicted TIM-barrel fold metal-dependent hydrolase
MSTNFRFSSLCNCGRSHTSSGINRRQWLKGGAALALGAGVTASGFTVESFAQGMSNPNAKPAAPAVKPHRIDVHHHISPPTWLDAVKSMKQDNPPLANWSLQKTLDDMDKGGVAVSITSPTTPQTFGLKAADAARIAKESNEYAKKLETDHKGRFGTWAMLPLPHIDESLKEIEYAFDTLKVDGVGIMTSYGDKWLGYAEFEPVWQELNRRKATVYTHPTGANCCANLVRGIAPALIEFGTDTTRSIFSVIFSGVVQKYPDINWIWSHGGGALTAFYERFTVQALAIPPYKGKFTREQIDQMIDGFYYDTAAIPNDVTLAAVKKMVPTSQIVFGSDFPYRRATDYLDALKKNFSADELKAVDRDNALKLVPRFKEA